MKKSKIKKILYICFLICILSPTGISLVAQNLSGNNVEKYPETRDPRYLPPFIPDNLSIGTEASGALLIFSPEGGGLASYLSNQKKEEIESRRKNNRYLERETERMLQRGLYKELLEKETMEQLGAQGFSYNAGSYPYKESKTRRFSIIFLLALPITAGISFGGIRIGKTLVGDTGNYTNNESILGGILSFALAFGIAIYDNYRVAELMDANNANDNWPPELRKREGVHPEDFSSFYYDLPENSSIESLSKKSLNQNFADIPYQRLIQFDFRF